MKADELYSAINGMERQLNDFKNNADKLLNDAYLCGKADQQKETADHLADINKQVEEARQEGKEYGLDESDMREAVSYQKGLDDAWEAARKIVCDEDFSMNELYKIFRKGSSDEILMDFTATEALERIKAYEKEKQKADDEIKVGDEVICNGHKFIVFATETEERYASLFDVNGRHVSASQRECKKTGRHFDIESILEAMKR